MSRTINDLLAQQASSSFVGREDELATLMTLLEPTGPVVMHVHGIGGIGKTALLDTFAARCRRTPRS